MIPHGATTDKQCSTFPVMGGRRNVWAVATEWSVRVLGDNSTAVGECVAGGVSQRRAWVLRVSKSCDGECTHALSCRNGLASGTDIIGREHHMLPYPSLYRSADIRALAMAVVWCFLRKQQTPSYIGRTVSYWSQAMWGRVVRTIALCLGRCLQHPVSSLASHRLRLNTTIDLH